MPSIYGSHCNNCPYNKTNDNSSLEITELELPLSMENNSGGVLLIFQAPGIDEWKRKKPICSNNSGSAAARIRNSLKRVNKKRINFNITNAIQCYPGKLENGRDRKPVKSARNSCSKWLKMDIESAKYRKIIVFGALAKESVSLLGYLNEERFLCLPHPSGGLSNETLDSALFI